MTTMSVGEAQRRWVKRLGYPLLALVTFVFALHVTFPYQRLESMLA